MTELDFKFFRCDDGDYCVRSSDDGTIDGMFMVTEHRGVYSIRPYQSSDELQSRSLILSMILFSERLLTSPIRFIINDNPLPTDVCVITVGGADKSVLIGRMVDNKFDLLVDCQHVSLIGLMDELKVWHDFNYSITERGM